jgi:hypothetical protein
MNRIVAVAFGVLAVVGATAAFGQERNPQIPGTGEVTGTGTTGNGSSLGIGFGRADRQSPPPFTFGGLDVRIWAPVEPHFNTEANRNLAEQTIWGAG